MIVLEMLFMMSHGSVVILNIMQWVCRQYKSKFPHAVMTKEPCNLISTQQSQAMKCNFGIIRSWNEACM